MIIKIVTLLLLYLSLVSKIGALVPILDIPDPLYFTLQHAVTDEEKSWGLMGRRSLPSNYGMLFAYSKPTWISLWSFNCYVDLGIGFLDEGRVIREITILPAYPEKMDPKRPIYSLKDLKQYPPLYPTNDPILTFFQAHSIICKQPSMYALETTPSFFQSHRVKVGDVIAWMNSSLFGYILYTQDISAYMPVKALSSTLQLREAKPLSVWAPGANKHYKVKFYDSKGELLQQGIIGSRKSSGSVKVESCLKLVSHIVLTH